MDLFETKKHSIGKTIAELRKEKGWTQAELAQKLQVSDKAVSKWEKDIGIPSVEFFPMLAALFGVSIDYIMTGKSSESEIIFMSKAKFCAKNDDVSMLDAIDIRVKDEDGKTLIDYIVEFQSIKVFVAIAQTKGLGAFGLVNGLKLAITSNRLDLIDKSFGKGTNYTPMEIAMRIRIKTEYCFLCRQRWRSGLEEVLLTPRIPHWRNVSLTTSSFPLLFATTVSIKIH